MTVTSWLINTCCSQKWKMVSGSVDFLQIKKTFDYLGYVCFMLQHYHISMSIFPLEMSVSSYSLCFSLCLRSPVLLLFLLLSVLLTQQPPSPPGAAVDNPACPDNDSNHPISHRGTENHCEVGLGSIHCYSMN